MRAAVLIPVHNRREITLRCLRVLRAAELPAEFGVIVVDDGSTDGTAEAILAEFPDVILVRGDGHLFWTGGIVAGMRHALAEGAAFLFWLNDDCRPDADALPLMLDFLEQNPRAICGASCFAEGGDVPVQTAFRQRKAVTASERVTEVDGLSGFCVGLPATICAEIGFPDERRLPHYGADGIYTLLAKRRHYRVVLLRDARVTLLDKISVSSLRGTMCVSELRWAAFVRQTFFRRKSAFFLRGQFWYHAYKYGFLFGSILFLVKVCGWAWTMAFFWCRRSASAQAV